MADSCFTSKQNSFHTWTNSVCPEKGIKLICSYFPGSHSSWMNLKIYKCERMVPTNEFSPCPDRNLLGTLLDVFPLCLECRLTVLGCLFTSLIRNAFMRLVEIKCNAWINVQKYSIWFDIPLINFITRILEKFLVFINISALSILHWMKIRMKFQELINNRTASLGCFSYKIAPRHRYTWKINRKILRSVVYLF